MSKLRSKIDWKAASVDAFDGERSPSRFLLDEFGTIGRSVGIQCKTEEEAKRLFKKYKKKAELFFEKPKKK